MTDFIDLRSDTVTLPTQEMRQFMYEAQVGDDVYNEDPTINRLQEQGAALLGKEAALFVTSGTQGNQLAIMSHTRRGDDVIVSDDAHIYTHEVGAAAVLSGVNMHPLHFPKGIFDAAMIEEAIQGQDIHEPPTGLICMENTLANGRVVPEKRMAEVYGVAQKHHLPVHVDGARLFNAAVAQNVDVRQLTQNCDSVMCCLSKGLCAPVGSLLAGSADFIARARKYRKMLGGGLRQGGFLAAAGLEALDNMRQRLAEDHQNARYLAEGLAKIPGIQLDLESVQSNMVFFTLDAKVDVQKVQEKLLAAGIKGLAYPAKAQRFVTHHGIEQEDLDKTLAILAWALA